MSNSSGFVVTVLSNSPLSNSPDSLVAVTSGGITINLLFDAAAMAAPASFRAAIQQAATMLTAAISDQITVNIKVDYSGTGGGASAGPDAGLYESYASTTAVLISHESPGDTIFNALPPVSLIQGQSQVAVWNAQLKSLGLLGATAGTDDGEATFATDINQNLLVGVALHELTHALGRVPYGTPADPSGRPDIFDLFRFTSPGVRLFQSSATAPAAYFSVDGGLTKFADYGQTSDSSDFLNSGVQGPNDPFNEFYTGNTNQQLTTVDLKQLDALGFHLTANTPAVIESNGSTSLVQVGNGYFLYPVGGSSGPQLKLNGVAVAAGSGPFASWKAIGAEQTASGYEVAWTVTGADQYTVWNTDSSGNFLSNIGVVSGGTFAFQSLETSFQQDLNGDRRIGLPPATVIEANGSTSLVQLLGTYALYPVGGSSGPQLKLNGVGVAAGLGQFAGWTAIGAEQTAGGYEVAWKVTGADQYTVWNTDSSGNFLSNIGVVSGGSYALQSREASFQQDLNGDGRIGPPPPQVIEANGATSLVQIADAYFMYPVGGSSGPQLPITTSSIAPWTPIGAERTASGYEVAFRINGADQYMIWNTDVNGNYVSSPIGVVSGGSSALESMETSFHQDLNNDGIIGSTTFDITVNYSGDPTYQSYFTAAAQRWQQVITADLPDVDSATYGHIDDLLISASVTSIDGPGGILGQAGPDLFRSTGSHLPYHGVMQFDSADLASLAANGELSYVILHEMGHVLGFGSSLWSADGLTIGSQYIGADAVNAYRQLGGGPTNSVPLETTGGAGTAGSHWSEAVFGNELMTGFISGIPDPLSILTVGAMQDLGYTVNYGAADPYSLPGHIAAQDGSSSIVANVSQLASDFGNVGTLGLDTG